MDEKKQAEIYVNRFKSVIKKAGLETDDRSLEAYIKQANAIRRIISKVQK